MLLNAGYCEQMKLGDVSFSGGIKLEPIFLGVREE